MFKILRMGIGAQHPSTYKVNRPDGYDHYLLLLVKSQAVFRFSEKLIHIPSNTLVLYDRKYPHQYNAYEGPYKDDWIHFECCEPEYDFLQLPTNQPIFLTNTHSLSDITDMLATEFFSNNLFKEQTIDHLMQMLFAKAKEAQLSQRDYVAHTKLYDNMVLLRRDIYSNPQREWTIERMAKELSLSSGHLQKVYKDLFSVSCMAEVIESRINRSKELLISSGLLVYEVAEQCGYKTEVHFMRQFKKSVGMTPSAFRKLHYNNTEESKTNVIQIPFNSPMDTFIPHVDP